LAKFQIEKILADLNQQVLTTQQINIQFPTEQGLKQQLSRQKDYS